MKYIKFFESFDYGICVGYHSSDNPNLEMENNYPCMGVNDYYEWHEEILRKIIEKYEYSSSLNDVEIYQKANEYLQGIENGEDVGFQGDYTTEISRFLEDIGIYGIFVNEDRPDRRWGKYSYEVYFKSIEFDKIFDFILGDEGEDGNYLYIFQNEKPVLKKI